MELLPFIVTALLLELTPGPNMVWLVLLTALHGRRAGLLAVLGIALGLLLPGLVAAFGMSSLIATSPGWVTGLRWAGVVYLLWLAWQSWPWPRAQEATIVAQAVGQFRHVRDGLLVNLFNIKSALFFLLALPDFARPDRPMLPQTLILTGLYVAIATGVHLILVGLAGKAHDVLMQPMRARRLQQGGAILIALVALWLAAR